MHQGSSGAPGIVVVPNAAERLAHTVQQLVEDSTARDMLASMAYKTYTGKYMWYPTLASYKAILATSTPVLTPELRPSTEPVHA